MVNPQDAQNTRISALSASNVPGRLQTIGVHARESGDNNFLDLEDSFIFLVVLSFSVLLYVILFFANVADAVARIDGKKM